MNDLYQNHDPGPIIYMDDTLINQNHNKQYI